MSKILVVGQQAEGKLNAGVAKVIAAAKAVGGEIHVALFAKDAGGSADAAAKLDGVNKVLKVERAENDHALAAIVAPQIVELAKSGGYSPHRFSGPTLGRYMHPRV